MSAFSLNRRRILSLWLPRLPIDRIKRQLPQALFRRKRVIFSPHERCAPSPACGGGLGWGCRREFIVWREPPPASHLFDAIRPKSELRSSRPPQAGEVTETPTVVVAKQNNALVIHALDDVAARSGLAIGLPLANARAICPELTVFDADPVADAKTLGDIADWCDRFTPLVALDPPYGLYLDITGCAHLFGGERALLQTVCGALSRRGFAVSAAIAGTSICARTLTRHASGKIIADGEEAEAVGSAAGLSARRR